MTIEELSNKALNYILTKISFGNYNTTYVPSGYLKPDGSSLVSYNKELYWNGGGYKKSGTFCQTVYTEEAIPDEYLAQVSDGTITTHWNAFKALYIDTLFVDKTNAPISLSSFLIFIYLFRCFMDSRFKLFTDSYHKDYVWLYNTTEDVVYNVDISYIPTSYTSATLSLADTQTYITKIINEIINKDVTHVLNSKTVAKF